MARVSNVETQHALNTGEKSLPGTRYKLDYIAKKQTPRTSTIVACSIVARNVSRITAKTSTIHSPSNL